MTDIKTTHTGSLPRPADLTKLLIDRDEGHDSGGLDAASKAAVELVVRRQADTGIDLINDGEQGKASYATYVKHRLTGFDGPEVSRSPGVDEYPDFTELQRSLPFVGGGTAHVPSCNGPVSQRDSDAARRDVAILRAAAEHEGIPTDRLFMTAASPGLIASYFHNNFYADRESYLAAIIDAMREEYRIIVDADITLQLDCPDCASHYSSRYQGLSVVEFRRVVAQSIEAINTATAGLPPEKIRFHVCWGNGEGPHDHDIELKAIIDILLTARPAGLVLEASNPRHGHEWQVFEDVRLPDDKYLVPGVIDTTTNFIEHPELVAQRIARYSGIVGKERVVAGTDCGFGTWAGPRRVAPSIAWAKLNSLVAGARLASSID